MTASDRAADGVLSMCRVLGLLSLPLALVGSSCVDRRPAPKDRKFVSPAVDRFLAAEVKRLGGDLGCVFGTGPHKGVCLDGT